MQTTEICSEWLDIVTCPFCGSKIVADKSNDVERQCDGCHQFRTLHKNVIQWEKGPPLKNHQETRSIQNYLHWKYFKAIFDPYINPISPLAILQKIRYEHFYRRTLSDKALATKWVSHYLKDLSLKSSATILDFGCGRGRTTALLSQFGYNVAGQDIYYNAWWHMMPDSCFQVVASGAPLLPWRSGSFDCIVSIMVVHYMTFNEVKQLIKNMFSVLKPGGYWVLLEGNSEGFGAKTIRKNCGHLHTLDQVEMEMLNAGFAKISQSFEGFYSPIFLKVVNYLRHIVFSWDFDVTDYKSIFYHFFPPKKRGLWLLKLKKNI